MKTQKDLKQALVEIDKIYDETVAKLGVLHQRKLDLIKQYKKKSDADILSKIRKFLNTNI